MMDVAVVNGVLGNDTVERGSESTNLSSDAAERIASLFKALADPNRVRLINELFEHERCVSDLSMALKLEQSAVSHQLRVLRNLRLVKRRLDGRHAYYALDDVHARALFAYVLNQVNKPDVVQNNNSSL